MKKVREEIQFKNKGGITDIFDDYVKGLYNITDEEYDFLAEKMSHEEMDIFVSVFNGSNTTFSEKRKALEIRNKYLKQYNDERTN
jgi:hypothetical protein